MATSPAVPNTAFRRMRGSRSPGEFAAAVRRAARDIGEQVACDARYVGRVESGEIRCPNYAYERVFLHMFPGKSLADLGFFARETVRGRGAATRTAARDTPAAEGARDAGGSPGTGGPEESDMLRRAFMASGSAGVACVTLGVPGPRDGARAGGHSGTSGRAGHPGGRIGEPEVRAVEEEVRRIRLLDDRHGADGLFRRATEPLRAAYALLDSGHVAQRALSDRLHAGAGELAVSVGWLAHDSGRFDQARSHYAEALATARVADDPALEAHAFCNTSFLAHDCGKHREAVRAAQAGRRAAQRLGTPRLLALLSMREAAGWAGLGDRSATASSLARAHAYFERGTCDDDPEWMSFFGAPELAWQEARCHAALGDWPRAARHAYRATAIQDGHFARNLALYRVELAMALAHSGSPDEAAAAGHAALDLLDGDSASGVRSSRVQGIVTTTARVLLPQRRVRGVGDFLTRSGAGTGRPV
ncbi:tetratricopeptide repeat protein [Streptomyces montanisoli]|uniref:Tetratricopeptide repeat protein n=1 Tax=Streptomyces montanisoli TaxID=2798581 RepID=A0A940MJW8_9ACTN|nr:tetratricopeptide repeat protein [Streptomyces montanisoli]MBP0461465.1 tetratricopeptide repeat protein [Streptomyces montanisoli]